MAAKRRPSRFLRHALTGSRWEMTLPAWANQATQDLNQHFWQLVRPPQYGEPGATEDSRRVAWSLTIYGVLSAVTRTHRAFGKYRSV